MPFTLTVTDDHYTDADREHVLLAARAAALECHPESVVTSSASAVVDTSTTTETSTDAPDSGVTSAPVA